jgi:hypothetical protein
VSELIHSSSNHQALEFARVSVHFHEIVDDPVRAGPRARCRVARRSARRALVRKARRSEACAGRAG